jgi:hypothetical protein
MIVFPWIYYGWLFMYNKDKIIMNSASELEIVKQISVLKQNKTEGNDVHIS